MHKNGIYWVRSERSSERRVTQVIDGKYYLLAEAEPVTEEEIQRRGWYVGKQIKKWDKP
jgi:hypothetical protein